MTQKAEAKWLVRMSFSSSVPALRNARAAGGPPHPPRGEPVVSMCAGVSEEEISQSGSMHTVHPFGVQTHLAGPAQSASLTQVLAPWHIDPLHFDQQALQPEVVSCTHTGAAGPHSVLVVHASVHATH